MKICVYWWKSHAQTLLVIPKRGQMCCCETWFALCSASSPFTESKRMPANSSATSGTKTWWTWVNECSPSRPFWLSQSVGGCAVTHDSHCSAAHHSWNQRECRLTHRLLQAARHGESEDVSAHLIYYCLSCSSTVHHIYDTSEMDSHNG